MKAAKDIVTLGKFQTEHKYMWSLYTARSFVSSE